MGVKAPAIALLVVALGEVVPGAIHYFAPDGGAGTIAGMHLGANAPLVTAMFAWTGSVQIPFGLLLIGIALRQPRLVPYGLAAVMVERGLMAWDGWLGKAARLGHHPPEHYASPAVALLCLMFLMVALKRRESW